MENLTEREAQFLAAVKTELTNEVKSLKDNGLTMEQIQAAIDARHQEATKGLATETALKALEDAVIEVTTKLNAMAEKTPKTDTVKTWGELAKEQGFTQQSIDEKRKSGGSVAFEVPRLERKQVGAIAYASNAYIPFPYMEQGWGEAPINKPVMKPICDTRPSPTARATWVERGAREGTIAATSPGEAKDMIDFTPVVATATAVKYPGYITFPDELLDDVDNFLMETQNDLINSVLKAEDDALITYAISKAKAYDLTDIKTTTPTKYESIMAMVTQVRSHNFEPTAVILNPLDFCMIEFDAFNNGYAVVGWINGGGPTIGGVPVYQSNQITSGSAMVGDMKKMHIREFKGLTVKLGLNGTDFTTNSATMVGEVRTIAFVKGGEEYALCYDAIGDVVTAITT